MTETMDMINHHIDDTELLEYAVGSTSEPLALLLATHITLCPTCRDVVNEFETVGGMFLDKASDNELDAHTHSQEQIEKTLEAIFTSSSESLDDFVSSPSDSVGDQSFRATARNDEPVDAEIRTLPRVLREYLDGNGNAIQWEKLTTGIAKCDLIQNSNGVQAQLMRIEPGKKIPRHTHVGRELTLILQGSMEDRGISFRRGDIAQADESLQHKPCAGVGEVCICLAVTEGDVRLTNPVTRLLSHVVRR